MKVKSHNCFLLIIRLLSAIYLGLSVITKQEYLRFISADETKLLFYEQFILFFYV